MKKHKRLFPYFIFFVAFWLVRLPYLIENPFPRFDGDSFDYYRLAYEIHEGIFPDFSVIPPAYSIFLYLMSVLNINTFGIILCQLALSFFGYIFLFHQLGKFRKINHWISLIVILIVSTTSFNLQLETSIITEPLYKPLLLILTGTVLSMYHSPQNKRLYFILPILVVLAALIRSNGMYLYFLIIALCFYLFFYKRKTHFRQFLICLSTFIGLNTMWAVSNYFSYDTLLFGNTYRIKIVLNNVKDGTRHNYNGVVRSMWQDSVDDGVLIYPYLEKLNYVQELQVKNIKAKPKLILNYLWSFCERDLAFYDEIIKERFDFAYSNGQLSYNVSSNDLSKPCFKDDSCREYALKEISRSRSKINEMSWWSLSADLLMKLNKFVFHNWIVLLLFWCIVGWESFRLFMNFRRPSKEVLLVSSIISMYLLHVVVIAMTHNRFCARYEQVNQFMIFIAIFVFFALNRFKRQPRA